MTTRTAFAVLALALGLVACGGGGDDENALSKAELAATADAICKKATSAARLLQVPPDFGQPNSNSVAAAQYLAQLVPITRKEADDLAALKPAADVKADWERFTAKEKELADYLERVLAKARANDPGALTDLQQNVPRLGQEFTTAAGRIGARGCASGA